MSRTGKSKETESRFMVAIGRGEGEIGKDCLKDKGFLFGVIKVSWK